MEFHTIGSTLNSYIFHPNGLVQLGIHPELLSIEEVRNLGFLLIDFADKYSADQLKKTIKLGFFDLYSHNKNNEKVMNIDLFRFTHH